MKAVAKEIEKRNTIAILRNPTMPYFQRPPSTARKANWIAYISNALASDDILNTLAPQTGAATATPPAAARSVGRSPRNAILTVRQSSATKQSPRDMLRERAAAAEARSSNKTPRKAVSTTSMSTHTAAASKVVPTSNTTCKRKSTTPSKTDSAKKSSAKKANNASNEAVASRLQQQCYNETLSDLGNYSTSVASVAVAASVSATSHQNSQAANRPYTAGSNNNRCLNKSSQTHKAKIKLEPKSPTRSANDDSIQPRDYKESAMVQSLRNMGFTDLREMLSGIRATSANNSSIFVPNQWSQQQQVESAMMWIVSQREEAAEARKLDEARVSSEMADRAMERSRREEMERQMKYADLNSLFGSGSTTSKYFPHSILLKNAEVQKVLHAIGSGPGKDAAIKLLQLESKARKWYGTVLPYAHFKHTVCSSFEAWSIEFLSSSNVLHSVDISTLTQKVLHESKRLEDGMYNLSEQEQGSFGMQPKLFLVSQRSAEAKGLSILDDASNRDEGDVVFVTSARCSVATSRHPVVENGNKAIEAIEVIEIV